jgi:hypothetical protein
MATMAVEDKEPLVSPLARFFLRVAVEHLLQLGQSKLVIGPT